jgi:predicted DNA-binding ribbon-helix-helix protein
MRTTVRLDDRLLERARREADRRGETLTALIERGLRLVLASPQRRPENLARLVDILDAAGHTHQPTGADLVTDATPEEVGELAAAHGVVLHGLVGTSDLEHAFFQLIHTAADDDSGPLAREMIT